MKVLKFILSILKDFGIGLLSLLFIIFIIGLIVSVASILMGLIMCLAYGYLGDYIGVMGSTLLTILLFICIVEGCNPFKLAKVMIENIVEYFQDKWNQIN